MGRAVKHVHPVSLRLRREGREVPGKIAQRHECSARAAEFVAVQLELRLVLEGLDQRLDVARRAGPRQRERRDIDADAQRSHSADQSVRARWAAEYPPRVAVDTAARSSALPTFGWLTNYGELLRTLLRREIRVRYKGSALGIVWALIYPLAMMGVYTLLFSVLWKTAGNIPHYPLFVLTGLAVWGFFQASLQLGSASLISSAELIKKVWFPRELIPTASVLAQTLVAGIMFAILIPVNLIVVPETARTLVLVIPFFAALLCLALGLAWIFSVAERLLP